MPLANFVFISSLQRFLRFSLFLALCLFIAGCGKEDDSAFFAPPEMVDLPHIPLQKGVVNYLFEPGPKSGPFPNKKYPMVYMSFPAHNFFAANADQKLHRTFYTTFYMYYHQNPERLTGLEDRENQHCIEGVASTRIVNNQSVKWTAPCENEIRISMAIHYLAPRQSFRKGYPGVLEDIQAGSLIRTDTESAYEDWELLAVDSHKWEKYPEEHYGLRNYQAQGLATEDRWTFRCGSIKDKSINPSCSGRIFFAEKDLMEMDILFRARQLPVAKNFLILIQKYMSDHLKKVYWLDIKK